MNRLWLPGGRSARWGGMMRPQGLPGMIQRHIARDQREDHAAHTGAWSLGRGLRRLPRGGVRVQDLSHLVVLGGRELVVVEPDRPEGFRLVQTD